jgi:hypothetical protein
VDREPSRQPTELFRKPLVAKVVGTGFDKADNDRYFTLRFPRIQKIHGDRSCEDMISFDDLQVSADRSSHIDHAERDKAENEWLAKLQGAKQWNSEERGYGDETTSQEESEQAEIAESDLGSDQLQSIHSHLACSDIDADERNVDSEHSLVDITSLKRKLLADNPPSPLGRMKMPLLLCHSLFHLFSAPDQLRLRTCSTL